MGKLHIFGGIWVIWVPRKVMCWSPKELSCGHRSLGHLVWGGTKDAGFMAILKGHGDMAHGYVYWLVVTGTMEFYDFPYIGNFIIPTDSYFSEG